MTRSYGWQKYGLPLEVPELVEVRDRSSMVEPQPSKLRTRVRFSPVAPSARSSVGLEQLPSKQQVAGSSPAAQANEELVRIAAKAYRAHKTGKTVDEIGERYTGDIGPMRSALKAIGLPSPQTGDMK